ncbi:hypothetical protein ACQJBY_059161 [Aegilops geniculata]
MASALKPHRCLLFLLPRLCSAPTTGSPHSFFPTHDLALGRPGFLAGGGGDGDSQEASGAEQPGRPAVSPRIWSAAELAGWDEEIVLLVALVIEDSLVRKSRPSCVGLHDVAY